MSERLSVTLARQHCEDGHGGKYEPYCYRCQYFQQVDEAGDAMLLALTKRRFWKYPRGQWGGRLGVGSDEYERYTVYVGPFVMALWRTPQWRQRVNGIVKHLSTDHGQDDRERNGGRS